MRVSEILLPNLLLAGIRSSGRLADQSPRRLSRILEAKVTKRLICFCHSMYIFGFSHGATTLLKAVN